MHAAGLAGEIHAIEFCNPFYAGNWKRIKFYTGIHGSQYLYLEYLMFIFGYLYLDFYYPWYTILMPDIHDT